jgi:two-component system, cell cycle sensor histidine kinase and response regulator CckA
MYCNEAELGHMYDMYYQLLNERTYASTIMYSFSSLLMAISGYTEMALQSGDSSDTCHQDVAAIKQAAGCATILLEQLRTCLCHTYSRNHNLDSHVFLVQTLPLLQCLVGDRVRMIIQLDVESAQLGIDPCLLKQVLVNLVVNARDAIALSGQISIRTTYRSVEQIRIIQDTWHVRQYLVMTITDTGGGIDPDIQPYVFEPFFTTKKPGRAAGLGLTTSRHIIRMYGGELFLESVQGCGTTATIMLPCNLPAEEACGLQYNSSIYLPRNGNKPAV